MKLITCSGLFLLAGLSLAAAAPAFAQASGQVPAQQEPTPASPSNARAAARNQANSNTSNSNASNSNSSNSNSAAQSSASTVATPPTESVPLGDAARKARQQKEVQEQSGKGAAKTWNNDNIPKKGQINVIGSAAPDNSASASGSGAASTDKNDKNAPAAKPTDAQAAAQLQSQLADARSKLDDLKKDAEIAQKKFDLDSDMYYGKPDYSSDRSGRASLDAEGTQVNDKKAQVEQAQKELDELQKKAGAAAPQQSAPEAPAQPPPPTSLNR